MKLIQKLQHKYALSEKGAKDMIKAFIACTISNIALMLPVGLLYHLVEDLMHKNMGAQYVTFYITGIAACLLFIFVATYFQYNATFFATYVESGVRRISLAEKLRKLPLSFFGKKDLSDLTSTIMEDCSTIETASSHWIPELIGAIISTFIVALSLFFFDWRMAIAALWVLPVSFIIVLLSSKVQHTLGKKQMNVKMSCADGIQECLESVRDLKANNAEKDYMRELNVKIKNVEKRAIISELGTAAFVVTSQMILKLGIATVALAGGIFLIDGSLDVLTFFMFLLLVSRLYDPMQMSLQNFAAIISANIQCERMDEILGHDAQTGSKLLTHKNYDIVFDQVAFAYDNKEKVKFINIW